MKLIRFLGSIYLAIFLISSTALFVIAGTVLESLTASHRYAAHFTYSNPLFKALLWGFFLNILISALLRWPFRQKHVPFLVTHLGLLMLLGGTLIKAYYGTQGSLLITEGSSSAELLLPDTYSIRLWARDKRSEQYPLSQDLSLSVDKGKLPEISIDLAAYAPHSQVSYESWIKRDQVFIQGLKPFAVHPEPKGPPFPISSKVRLNGQVWDLMAFKTEESATLARKIYQQGLKISGEAPFKIEVAHSPTLLFLDTPENVVLYTFDKKGHVQEELYPKSSPKAMAVYDQGYGGYFSFAKIEKETFESLLQCRCLPQPPSQMLEENIPQITLRLRNSDNQDFITLPFERQATGLKWPVLKGQYLARFQPLLEKIPYRVRLRQAREIKYPHSTQPFSYESDLIFTELKTGRQIEKTISMNNVHETWDGYRFYLANITTGDLGSIKKVQIIVNRDPAKYWLTYPGAFFLSAGIFLLFWLRPYRKV